MLIAAIFEYIWIILCTLLAIAVVSIMIYGIYYLIHTRKNESKNEKTEKSSFNRLEIKHVEFVKKHSAMYQELVALNKKYSFEKIIISNYNEICDSLREYKKIDEDVFLKEKIEYNFEYYKQAVRCARNNSISWNKYLEERAKCVKYLSDEEIKAIPNRKVRIKVFKEIERKLYRITVLPTPIRSFVVSAEISYTSPQGRNSYSKEARLTFEQLKRLLETLEIEIMERQKQKNILFEQMRQEALEKEASGLLKEIEKEKARENKRKSEREFRERVREEERKKVVAENEKTYTKLKKYEESLIQREEEFKQATHGHIYSLNNNNYEAPSIANEQSKQEETLWMKLKRIKEQFNSGEISCAEYEEKRKELLQGKL